MLERLVAGPREAAAVWPSLKALPYDCEDELVVLTRSHICAALEQYLAGAISAKELENWAEMLEGRPGIEYEPDPGSDEDAHHVATVLFDLSTPEINPPLTHLRARELIERLRGAL
jgi:hypothetical protein